MSGINFREVYCRGELIFERLTTDTVSREQESPKNHLDEIQALVALPKTDFVDIEQPGATRYGYVGDEAEKSLRNIERSAERNYAASFLAKMVDERLGVVPVAVFSLMYPDPKNIGQRLVARIAPSHQLVRDGAGYVRNNRARLIGHDPARLAEMVLSDGIWLAADSGVEQLDVVVADRLLEEPVRPNLTVIEAFAPLVPGFVEVASAVYQATEGSVWGGPGYTGFTNDFRLKPTIDF